MFQMKLEGYDIEVPSSVEELRDQVLNGNSSKFGQDANVACRVDADWIVKNTPWLEEIEINGVQLLAVFSLTEVQFLY